MRRLADRYVLELAWHLANGVPVPVGLGEQISRLPGVMERGEARASNVERAVIDLLEAIALQNRIGDVLDAEVVDAESGIVQTTESAIRSRAARLGKASNGARVRVRIDAADPMTRKIKLTAVE